MLLNKKVGFDYELLEKYEAGIKLFGLEVKSLREKKGKIDGAHVTVRGGEAYLLNAHIAPYQPLNTPEAYDALRPRKLLLKKSELAELGAKEAEKGLTLVPIKVYNKKGKIKVEIAVARGKRKFDKRETLKKKQAKREIERTLKRRL